MWGLEVSAVRTIGMQFLRLGDPMSFRVGSKLVAALSRPHTTHRPLSSSCLGLPCRVLNINHKKELLRGLWVLNPKPQSIPNLAIVGPFL